MKKLFFSSFIVLALLAITTGTVFAGAALELVQVRSDGGLPTFVFRVTGEFSQSELESGFVQVEGGDDYPLYCAQTDATTVVCHTSKAVSGHDVVIGFGGAKFWEFVPEFASRAVPQYCYNVFDYDTDTETYWVDYGDYCQDHPASIGEEIYWYNPGWDGYYYYSYGLDDSNSHRPQWKDLGPGYYY